MTAVKRLALAEVPAPPATARAKRPTLADIRTWPATVDVAQAALALGVSRSGCYESIRRGEFPAKVITVSRRKLVITSSLLELLGGGNGTAGH